MQAILRALLVIGLLAADATAAVAEERGTADFPTQNGRKLYGELLMNLTIDASGRIVDAEVVQSSNPARHDADLITAEVQISEVLELRPIKLYVLNLISRDTERSQRVEGPDRRRQGSEPVLAD